jgi:hypothetical protein
VFFSEVESSWIDLDAHIIVQDSWKRT